MTAPLYDVEDALRVIAQQRRKRDELSTVQTELADRLARNMVRHFGPEAVETAGLAMVIAAASAGALATRQVSPEVLVNVIAFAGQRLVVDAREAERKDAGNGGGES